MLFDKENNKVNGFFHKPINVNIIGFSVSFVKQTTLTTTIL